MDYKIFEHEEISARIACLQDQVREMNLDGAFIMQRADLVYYTGAAFHGALAVPRTGEPLLFGWRGSERAEQACPVPLTPVKGFGKLHEALLTEGLGSWKRIGFEKDVLPVSMYERMLARVWPNGEAVDISTAVRSQRAVKRPAELELVRRSGRILATGFDALREILKEGVYEYEAQALMDVVMRGAGDQGMGRSRGFNSEARGVVHCGASGDPASAFDGPIAQPGRTPLVPAGSGSGQIRPGQPIIADHTAGWHGYMTDMTRTFHIGELEQKHIEAHELCVRIHQATLEAMVPGAIPADLWAKALEMAEEAGFGDVFMNHGANKVRFLGHGVGLELDEFPVLARPFTEPLAAGNVVAVEPKVIFEDGAGVGVEDTVIVTPDGAEIVTPMQHGLIEVGVEPKS